MGLLKINKLDFLGAVGTSCHRHLSKNHSTALRCPLMPLSSGRACLLNPHYHPSPFPEVCLLHLPLAERVLSTFARPSDVTSAPGRDGSTLAVRKGHRKLPLRKETPTEHKLSAQLSGVFVAHHSSLPGNVSDAFACCSLPWFCDLSCLPQIHH